MELSKRHALSLSAVLAATVLTGGAAILGLSHSPLAHASQPAVVAAQPAPASAPQAWGEGD